MSIPKIFEDMDRLYDDFNVFTTKMFDAKTGKTTIKKRVRKCKPTTFKMRGPVWSKTYTKSQTSQKSPVTVDKIK